MMPELANYPTELRDYVNAVRDLADEVCSTELMVKFAKNHPAREIIVATTRPETMLGDTAVAIHPDDDRYRDLIGKQVRLPITNRLIPIIAASRSHPAPRMRTWPNRKTPVIPSQPRNLGRSVSQPQTNAATTKPAR